MAVLQIQFPRIVAEELSLPCSPPPLSPPDPLHRGTRGPDGGGRAEGRAVLCGAELLRDRAVDQRWPGSGDGTRSQRWDSLPLRGGFFPAYLLWKLSTSHPCPPPARHRASSLKLPAALRDSAGGILPPPSISWPPSKGLHSGQPNRAISPAQSTEDGASPRFVCRLLLINVAVFRDFLFCGRLPSLLSFLTSDHPPFKTLEFYSKVTQLNAGEKAALGASCTPCPVFRGVGQFAVWGH